MDVICMGANAVYINRPLNIEFLDQRLCIKDNFNIFQENLFIVLSSLEMIDMSCLFSIFHIAIVIPFRWLVGNTHQLAHRKWGAIPMGCSVDIFCDGGCTSHTIIQYCFY